MRSLLFRMDGKDVHRNAEFRMRFPDGYRSRAEQIIAVFILILTHPKCRSKVLLDVSGLSKSEMHHLRAAIQSADPYNEWDTDVLSAMDYYKEMSCRQRQVLFLIPLYTDNQIATTLNVSFNYVRELHKQIYDITDCHSKTEICMLVKQLMEAGINPENRMAAFG